jgi:anti-sigma regulatory factor (Ser/Thr protein kinase)
VEKKYQYKAYIQQIVKIQEEFRLLKAEWKLPDSETKQILTVIEELFSKLITNNPTDEQEHIIEIFVRLENRIVIFTVQDNSNPFNPFKHDIYDLQDSSFFSSEAMDISLIKTFIDSYTYNREEGKNIFVFHKTLKG